MYLVICDISPGKDSHNISPTTIRDPNLKKVEQSIIRWNTDFSTISGCTQHCFSSTCTSYNPRTSCIVGTCKLTLPSVPAIDHWDAHKLSWLIIDYDITFKRFNTNLWAVKKKVFSIITDCGSSLNGCSITSTEMNLKNSEYNIYLHIAKKFFKWFH